MSNNNENDQQNFTKGVEVYRRVNRLKMKITGAEIGPAGQVDANAIAEADEKIKALCRDCPDLLKKCLDQITQDWKKMQKIENGDERKKLVDSIFIAAHEIKDVGSMCGFELLAHFAESLRDYIILTDLSHKAHTVIIQAHVDAMNITLKEKIMAGSSSKAAELKHLVHKAIYKYS